MTLFIPDALKLLLIHDRQLVTFYPYANNQSYSFDCWLIVEDYNELNRPENAAAKIQLFSRLPNDEVLGILDQPYALVFQDGEEFYLSGVNVIPIENNQITVKTKSKTAKFDNATINNAWQYNNFAFNLINLGGYIEPPPYGNYITTMEYIEPPLPPPHAVTDGDYITTMEAL